MNDRLDTMLRQLRSTPPDGRLDRLEAGVWERIEKRGQSDLFSGRTLQVQLAVTCGALLLGAFVAQWTGMEVMPSPLFSETVVLSDDSALAPSVRLEGGA